MTLSAGTQLGPYEILSPIGAGGMGEVYRAKDTRLKRDVAVKVLPDSTARDPEALSRFQREAEAVAALSHPNILAIHDVGSEQGVSYVVMELLEGETLRDCVRRSAIPWRKAVEYGVAIADGLAAAHAKGIIHRDLKPENIFLTSEGLVKILDFGLARVAPVGTNVPAEQQAATPTITLDTRPGTVLGTVNYMSPEQISGRATDARTDIFSFGCVLHEMVTGQRAFSGKSMAETSTAILRDEPPSLADSGRVVPVELGRVITRSLEKKSELRIQSARDLGFALRDVLSDSGLGKAQGAQAGPRKRTMLGVQIAMGVVAVVVLLIALNVGGWRERLFSQPQTVSIHSLAVLPLENLSGDPEQEYFADGMTDALITNLSKIGALRVISRTSAMRYKGTDKRLPEIARELNVDAVVEGSVLRVGNRVRITAQLIEAATDRHLWAESYEREMGDILAMQTEVARDIAKRIQIRLTSTEHELLASAPRVNPEAYDAYVRGMEMARRNTRRSCQTALTFLDQALDLDPEFALAHAGRAKAYFLLASTHLHPADTMPAMKQAADAALALDENLPEAHIALGRYKMQYEWDWDGAEKSFERALELNSSLGEAHLAYADYLVAMKRPEEGMAQLDLVLELSPAAPYTERFYGAVSFTARRFERTIRDGREALKVDPEFWPAHQWMGLAQGQLGQFADGVDHLRTAHDLSGSPTVRAMLGAVLALGGEYKEARSIREELRNLPDTWYVCPYEVATISIALNEYDEAFDDMVQACDDRAACIPYLQVDPRLDPIRDDPRFNSLLERVGFEPDSKLRVAETDKPRRIMLAVLPFENMGPEPQEWFSDGMTDELISTLARISALNVISRTSTMRYKDTNLSLPEIARELKANVIVTGSVLSTKDRFRITVQLIDADTDTHLWSDSYVREKRDVLALQADVTRAIAEEIQVKLSPQEHRRLARGQLVDPEAYETYLQGRSHLGKRTVESGLRAAEFFEKATRIDPEFALGYSGLASAYTSLETYYFPPHEIMPKAKRAALKALELDPTLAEAHAALGRVKFNYDWDWDGAERAYKRALELKPGLSDAHLGYARHLVVMGRAEEAFSHLAWAQEYDPYSVVTSEDYGLVYYLARRYDRLIEYCRRAISIDRTFWVPHTYLGLALEQKGQFDEAIDELKEARRLSENPATMADLGAGYAFAGRPQQAKRVIEELEEIGKERYVCPYRTSTIHVGLGNYDEAFENLNQACEDRSDCMPFVKLDPRLDLIRDDIRFDSVIECVGFEPVPPESGKAKLIAAQPPHDSSSSDSPGREGRIMLAVLAFKNLGSAEDEYFADGISDEIRSRLAAVRKLGVISRSSAFQYKDTDKSNRQIGSELGVEYLIDGTIRWDKRAGGAGRVRITPELIRISDDVSLWSQPYNRVIEDIFEVQSDIAGRVIKQLKITLLEPERQAIEVIPTENTDAYHAYLRGLYYTGRPDVSEETLRPAIQMFERAVSLDPSFALAHALLSKAHSGMHHYGYDPTEARAAKAKSAADLALELQPDLSEAYLAMGYYHYWCNREYDLTLEALAIAEKDLPNDARILKVVGFIRRRQGRFESALDNLKRAFELSPLNAGLANNIAQTYLLMRGYPKAERWCNRSISLAPDQLRAYRQKAQTRWLWHGDTTMARATLEEMPKKHDPFAVWAWFQQELFERNYQAALDRIDFPPVKGLELQVQFISNAQLAGLIHQLMRESNRAREAYDAARILLEEEIKKRPDDHRIRSSLGIAYAGLGRTDDAIREGKLGVELFPASKDALIGPYRVADLAFIYTLVGEHDAALDRLEYLLSIPSETMSVPMLRLDPRWDPLRDHPRYKELIRRHGLDPDSKPQATEPLGAKPPDDPTDSGG